MNFYLCRDDCETIGGLDRPFKRAIYINDVYDNRTLISLLQKNNLKSGGFISYHFAIKLKIKRRL